MIKEKAKKKKNEKSIAKIVSEFMKTIFLSFLFSVVVTVFLSWHARNEMIKNLYLSKQDKITIDRSVALRLISETDLTKSLGKKNYAVCMQVGQLYEAAGDYLQAEFAYRLAAEKSKNGNYTAYYKLAEALIAQDKFDEVNYLLDSITDYQNVKLIKFKTRVNISLGDKYYSMGKFLKAATAYENAKYYYDKFSKQDKLISNSIINRLINSYISAADVIVKNGYNTEAVVFLKKALKYDPESINIKYKLAIVLSDLDPQASIEYFEDLMKSKPQYVDYSTYNKTLIKAANIYELEGQNTKAKYYRYKSHSLDIFVDQKVIYKNDFEVKPVSIKFSKFLFTYKVKANFEIFNLSGVDINKMYAEFVFKQNNNPKEVIVQKCATKQSPLLSNSMEAKNLNVEFGHNIFTKKELENYSIELYLYKDKNFKTLIDKYSIIE